MNKVEFRKHCEDQIEKCIKLHDSKHLKEHELSLALLNECEQRKKNQENLIKYIEDKIEEIKEHEDFIIKYLSNHPLAKKSIDEDIILEKSYKDLLERIKNNNYE